jgi:hypothetical protein
VNPLPLQLIVQRSWRIGRRQIECNRLR